jgi:hypothetical protein
LIPVSGGVVGLMKTILPKSGSRGGRAGGWLIKIFGVMLVLTACWYNVAVLRAETEPHYVPFDRESAVALIRKTVEIKMVPYEIKGNGFTLTITKLQCFKMDWEQARFSLKCSFNIKYNKLGSFRESGEFAMVGAGLIAPREQKLGVRIDAVPKVKLKGILSQFNEAIKYAVEKSLAGKEFWSGPAPPASETMTKENFSLLVQVALAQQLPWSGGTKDSIITLLTLHSLELLPQPGKISADFDMEGTRKGWFFKKHSGRADVAMEVWVDPDQLVGKIKIIQINKLKLDHTPGIVAVLIRGLVNVKLKGNELPFSWK